MKFHTDAFQRLIIILLLALVPAAQLRADAAPGQQRTIQYRMRTDTLRSLARRVEIPQLRTRMMTSPLPVEIKQQGRQLCIKSQYNQLLPIYTANGTFYSSMRLTKGTNWLTGLPRGAYMINNRRYTIN